MSEVDLVPEEAIAAGREAFVRCPKGTSSTRAAIEAAAPLILAAELERFADEIEAVADPAGDMWLKAEAAGRREVRHALRARASVLRGEGDRNG